MAVKYVDQLQLTGKRTFIRVDFNVPLDDQRRVTDDTRIREALPTIQLALKMGARVILASHLGRPKGPDPKLSLEPASARLAELLGKEHEVVQADDCIGDAVARTAKDLKASQVLMLENLRFHKEEEANDEGFARQLAALCDVYVNDAFGTAHRAHASTAGMVPFVKEKAAGLLIKKELENLGRVLKAPEKPFVAVLGGAKVSDKIKVIESLLPKVNALLIGGAMAYTFLKAQGRPVGKSRVEEQLTGTASDLLARASARGLALELPVDHVVAPALDANAPTETLVVTDPTIGDRMGLDIGPATVERYSRIIAGARTVVWNGPFGAFELPPFDTATVAVAKAVAERVREGRLVAVAGGGDTVAAMNHAEVADDLTYVSTAGGAFLEWMEGKALPGVEALRKG